MRQITFGQLMDWALSEYREERSIFGIQKLYKASGEALSLFGEKLELPFGPAAGPHTQLAQNLIAGYAAGGRFFELKTVQALDGQALPVSKPCILAPDEGYNVEWSTELYVPQAMDEYIKGWYALKLLSRELALGRPDGFVFNMSVGYDLAGIQTEKIDSFIEGLKFAGNTDCWKACRAWALRNLSKFRHVDAAYIESISSHVCASVMLSTLHGCPPEEIERIAAYLLREKKLHTFVKCNPTLLGYEYARDTLNTLGFDYIEFDDSHFKNDLQFGDAVPMLRRLQALADSLSLSFGVKLTNTFPVKITAGELPGDEMYMSGRALFPLSIEVANRLSKAFDGRLRISFSGGADARNISAICEAGIWPVTMATTLLKPGGYERLHQLAQILSKSDCKLDGVNMQKLDALVHSVDDNPMYYKRAGRQAERKINKKVPAIDCFTAPCRVGCPFGQDIPAYLRLAGEGKHPEALRVITERNPLPFITGTICSHHCADKCTRTFYEDSVHIREIKLETAKKAYGQLLDETESRPKSGDKIAIVGGGPAGLSAAYFLARARRPVTIFEKRDSLGGVVRHVIPAFRIADEAIDSDIALVSKMGIEVRLNCEVHSIDELRAEGFGQIIIATGAWMPGALELESGRATSALEFLERLKRDPQSVNKFIGENVSVIGGGNTAMDAARAAVRCVGVKNVSLVYRRTVRTMPADAEELALALQGGVEFHELLSPVSHKNGVLTCARMALGPPDASGRRSPVSTGQIVEVPADAVIAAIGGHVDHGLYERWGIPIDKRGRAIVSDTLEALPGVYVAGDALRGPSTVAEAIADAIRCAEAITGAGFDRYANLNINNKTEAIIDKIGVLRCGGDDSQSRDDSQRCLECATLCGCCVQVCPNRANITVHVDGRPQILHIDHMCNECGNCEVFCPYSGAPYKDKFTLFSREEEFMDSENDGFLPLGGGAVRVRLDGETFDCRDGARLPADLWALAQAAMKKEYLV